MKQRASYLATIVSIPFVLSPLAAAAQQAQQKSHAILEEVVVSATKREEKLQDVAVSVTALSSESLQNMGFQSITQLTQQVPNFTVQGLFGPSGPPYLNIRGVSFIDYTDMNESSVGVYVDEIYQGAPAAASGQLYDVQRMEILRGPQGTLFGRNTTGGLLHYISKKPTHDFDAYASYQVGSYKQQILEAAAGGPITDKWLARLAVKSNHDDGFQENVVTGTRFGETDIKAARLTTTLEPNDDVSATLSYHYAESDGSIPGYAVYGFKNPPPNSSVLCTPEQTAASQCYSGSGFRDPDPDPRHVYSDMAHLPNQYRADGGYLNMSWNLGWADLTSITGVENYKRFMLQDVDSYDAPSDLMGLYDTGFEEFSQELRLAGETNNIKWVGGLFYYTDERDTHFQFLLNRSLVFLESMASGETESKAVFAQADIPLTDQWTLVTGVRYTKETRDLNDAKSLRLGQPNLCPGATVGAPACGPLASYSNSISTNKPTYKASLEWRPNADVLTYLQYTTGFKSGSFGVVVPANVAGIGPVGEESVDSWELGAKTTWLDGRLRANGAAFYYDFANYQAIVGATINGTNTSLFVSAGDVSILGGEVELTYVPTEAWELSLGLASLKTEITAPDSTQLQSFYSSSTYVKINGNELPNAPAYSVNGAISYHFDMAEYGNLTFQTSFKYQDDIWFNIDNNPFKKQDAYGIANLRMIWESMSGRYRGEAFVDNAFDKEYQVHRFQGSAYDTAYAAWGMPRWSGVKFTVKY